MRAQLFVWCQVHFITSRSQACSIRIGARFYHRLACRLHQYDFQIVHISVNANAADLLSRLPSNSDSDFVCDEYLWFVCTSNISDLQAVTLSEMKSETGKDVTLSKLLTEIQSQNWSYDQQLKAYSGIKDELSVFEGVIL